MCEQHYTVIFSLSRVSVSLASKGNVCNYRGEKKKKKPKLSGKQCKASKARSPLTATGMALLFLYDFKSPHNCVTFLECQPV